VCVRVGGREGGREVRDVCVCVEGREGGREGRGGGTGCVSVYVCDMKTNNDV